MGAPLRTAAALVAVALLGAGVWQLRSATMSTHQTVDPDSQLVVTIDVDTRQAEGGRSAIEMAAAKVAMCRLEVRHADTTGPLEQHDDSRLRFVLQPSLDHTDRRQLRGCLEDWNVDHLRVDVVDMQEVAD